MNMVVLSRCKRIGHLSLRFFVLLACLGGVFFGCGTVSTSPSSQGQTEIHHQVPEGKALVYFYYGRKYLLGATSVALDGKSSLIEKDTYVLWEVEPGRYELTFTFERKWSAKTVEKTIACEPNQQYFFYLYPYTEDDEPQHKILQASSDAGRKKIRQFRLMHHFDDEAL